MRPGPIDDAGSRHSGFHPLPVIRRDKQSPWKQTGSYRLTWAKSRLSANNTLAVISRRGRPKKTHQIDGDQS